MGGLAIDCVIGNSGLLLCARELAAGDFDFALVATTGFHRMRRGSACLRCTAASSAFAISDSYMKGVRGPGQWRPLFSHCAHVGRLWSHGSYVNLRVSINCCTPSTYYYPAFFACLTSQASSTDHISMSVFQQWTVRAWYILSC